MRTLAPLFALSTLLATLPAQDKAPPFRFVPADSTVVLRLAGPAKWKQQFASTQITKVLQGQSLAPIMSQMTAAMDQAMEGIRQSGKFDADLVESMLKDYAGDITVALHLDLSNLADLMQTGETPAMGVAIAMAPDSSYDLAKLVAAIEKSADANAAELGTMRDLAIGDTRLRVAQKEEGATALPALVDGHLVFLAGNDLDKFAAKVLATDNRFAATVDGPMFLHAEIGAAMNTLIDTIGEQVGAMGAPFDPAQIMRDIGLGSLTSLQMSMGNDGKHVTAEYRIGMTEANRGMFDLMTGPASTPKLLRCVPSSAESFTVTPLQAGRLLEFVGKIWSALGDDVPMSWEQAMASATDALKVRLQEDVFAHIGGELLILQDPEATMAGMAEAEDDEEGMLAAVNGTCLGLALRDGKAFAESIEKMVRARGLHASRKTEEYQGTKVHKIKLAGILDLEYAITDDVMLLGLGSGEATHRSLRAILDARASTEPGLPTAAKDHVAALPEGWNGISCSSMASTFSAISAALEATGEMPEEARMIGEVLKGVAGDLKRLGIDRIVSTTYSTPSGITARLRW